MSRVWVDLGPEASLHPQSGSPNSPPTCLRPEKGGSLCTAPESRGGPSAVSPPQTGSFALHDGRAGRAGEFRRQPQGSQGVSRSLPYSPHSPHGAACAGGGHVGSAWVLGTQLTSRLLPYSTTRTSATATGDQSATAGTPGMPGRATALTSAWARAGGLRLHPGEPGTHPHMCNPGQAPSGGHPPPKAACPASSSFLIPHLHLVACLEQPGPGALPPCSGVPVVGKGAPLSLALPGTPTPPLLLMLRVAREWTEHGQRLEEHQQRTWPGATDSGTAGREHARWQGEG